MIALIYISILSGICSLGLIFYYCIMTFSGRKGDERPFVRHLCQPLFIVSALYFIGILIETFLYTPTQEPLYCLREGKPEICDSLKDEIPADTSLVYFNEPRSLWEDLGLNILSDLFIAVSPFRSLDFFFMELSHLLRESAGNFALLVTLYIPHILIAIALVILLTTSILLLTLLFALFPSTEKSSFSNWGGSLFGFERTISPTSWKFLKNSKFIFIAWSVLLLFFAYQSVSNMQTVFWQYGYTQCSIETEEPYYSCPPDLNRKFEQIRVSNFSDIFRFSNLESTEEKIFLFRSVNPDIFKLKSFFPVFGFTLSFWAFVILLSKRKSRILERIKKLNDKALDFGTGNLDKLVEILKSRYGDFAIVDEGEFGTTQVMLTQELLDQITENFPDIAGNNQDKLKSLIGSHYRSNTELLNALGKHSAGKIKKFKKQYQSFLKGNIKNSDFFAETNGLKSGFLKKYLDEFDYTSVSEHEEIFLKKYIANNDHMVFCHSTHRHSLKIIALIVLKEVLLHRNVLIYIAATPARADAFQEFLNERFGEYPWWAGVGIYKNRDTTKNILPSGNTQILIFTIETFHFFLRVYGKISGKSDETYGNSLNDILSKTSHLLFDSPESYNSIMERHSSQVMKRVKRKLYSLDSFPKFIVLSSLPGFMHDGAFWSKFFSIQKRFQVVENNRESFKRKHLLSFVYQNIINGVGRADSDENKYVALEGKEKNNANTAGSDRFQRYAEELSKPFPKKELRSECHPALHIAAISWVMGVFPVCLFGFEKILSDKDFDRIAIYFQKTFNNIDFDIDAFRRNCYLFKDDFSEIPVDKTKVVLANLNDTNRNSFSRLLRNFGQATLIDKILVMPFFDNEIQYRLAKGTVYDSESSDHRSFNHTVMVSERIQQKHLECALSEKRMEHEEIKSDFDWNTIKGFFFEKIESRDFTSRILSYFSEEKMVGAMKISKELFENNSANDDNYNFDLKMDFDKPYKFLYRDRHIGNISKRELNSNFTEGGYLYFDSGLGDHSEKRYTLAGINNGENEVNLELYTEPVLNDIFPLRSITIDNTVELPGRIEKSQGVSGKEFTVRFFNMDLSITIEGYNKYAKGNYDLSDTPAFYASV